MWNDDGDSKMIRVFFYDVIRFFLTKFGFFMTISVSVEQIDSANNDNFISNILWRATTAVCLVILVDVEQKLNKKIEIEENLL